MIETEVHMEHVTVSIDDSNGEYTFLVSDETRGLLDATSRVRRASHVLPWNPFLRALFIFIRLMCGDTGNMAEWTRKWPCYWQVNLSPVNGPLIPVEWANRQSAIDFEVHWLTENFL